MVRSRCVGYGDRVKARKRLGKKLKKKFRKQEEDEESKGPGKRRKQWKRRERENCGSKELLQSVLRGCNSI
jgi:hypothetical protein